MEYDEARAIVLSRLAEHCYGTGTEYSEEAIEQAIARLRGAYYEPEKEETLPEAKPSPLIAHTYGLHEKYFPDG